MSKLDDLTALLATLSSNEIKSVRKHIALANANSATIKDKSIDLFESLLKRDDSEIQSLDKKISSKKLSLLIQKTHEITLETLGLHIHIEQPNIYSPLGKAKLAIRKQMIYSQILGSRSLINQAIQMLKQTITQAKDVETYDELLICQYDLLNIYSVLNKTEEFSALHTEIKHYELIRSRVKECFFYYNWITQSLRKNPEDKIILETLKNILPRMKQFYQSTDSTQIGWYYYRLLIEYQQKMELYHNGYQACKDFLILQENSMFLKNSTFLSITYKMLAKFCIGLFRFDEAIEHLSKARNDERLQANIESIKTTLFFAYFYSGNFAKAHLTIKENTKGVTGLDLAIYSYYNACSLFWDAKSSTAIIQALAQTKEIEKDKEGWNIHVRLLQIMHLCEGKKWDVVQAHIESLRKHLERTRKSGNIQPRFLGIFKALRELANCGFDFGKSWKKQPDLFAQLTSETDEAHRWQMLSPELVRFDAWFEAKARRLTYAEIFAERVKVRQSQQISINS